MIDESLLEEALKDAGVAEYLEQAVDRALARSITAVQTEATSQPTARRLPRFALIFESQGGVAYHRFVSGKGTAEEKKASKDNFSNAFTCWQALLSLPDAIGTLTVTRGGQGVSQSGLSILQQELSGELAPANLTLAFRLAVAGLLAERPAETRLELRRFNIPSNEIGVSWRDRVVSHVFQGFALLCRKDKGWTDIDAALKSIDELRMLQKQHEEQYIDSFEDRSSQATAAYELVGLYHLAQMLTTAGDYLKDGQTALAQINIALDRNRERAVLAFESCRSSFLIHMTELLWVGCRELTRNAILSHTAGLGERAQQFARLLASRGRPRPVIELWPSQQEAFRKNLMDPYKRAILIEMPTSAGKTLLAKFLIVQTKALNPNANIAYVVPTRALVNQVTVDLRADFRELDPPISVEQAVPAVELDPTEERLLGSTPPGVLVTTPEKLDLLVRKGHPAVQNISLVVADEAHNLGTPDRGPRLELLLGMLRRDRTGIRFVLLSPYLPNADELVRWLGGDQALPPILVDWKPGRKIVGAVRVEGRRASRAVILETLPAADNTDVRAGIKIPIGTGSIARATKTISGLTRASVHSFLERGALLVLCRGQLSAVNRAVEIADELPRVPDDDYLRAVIHYLEAEAGTRTSLISCLEHGVAYHHAGLSQEARWLIETLIKQEKAKVVCGTTTLAQGVNFPISTVIVETLRKGEAKLTYQDFWNIAGRAGRALMDTLGVVAFPTPSEERLRDFEGFLRGEAEVIASQLTSIVSSADEIAGQFNLYAISRWPELSSLLQFLAHALYVSGRDDVADEVEDILRASLVFHQAQQKGTEIASALISLCRSYLQSIHGQRAVVGLAEQTGFATPSVFNLLARTKGDRELADYNKWTPANLFGQNIEPLTRRIEAIADLPEIRLGQGQRPPFNARRVAEILRGWIRGDSLRDLTVNYSLSREGNESERIGMFSNYLFSQLIVRASWGLGALETVSLGDLTEEQWKEVGYVPSMVYFGVNRREAIWLRMAGVPRIFANQLAERWLHSKVSEPANLSEIREWISKLGDTDWQATIPAKSSLTASDMRLLCKDLVG